MRFQKVRSLSFELLFKNIAVQLYQSLFSTCFGVSKSWRFVWFLTIRTAMQWESCVTIVHSSLTSRLYKTAIWLTCRVFYSCSKAVESTPKHSGLSKLLAYSWYMLTFTDISNNGTYYWSYKSDFFRKTAAIS